MNKYQELEELLKGGKKAALGEVRTWSNGTKAMKTADGWVHVAGPHKGKLHGKTKGPATHMEHVAHMGDTHQPKEVATAPKKPEYERYWDDKKDQWAFRPLEAQSKGPVEAPKPEPKPKPKPKEKPKAKEIKALDKELSKQKKPDHKKEAEQDLKDRKEDYDFARDSKVGNKGEDLKGSARHKRSRFDGLKDIEARPAAEAEKLMTRANLLKNDPIDLVSGTNSSNWLTRMTAYKAIQNFPPKPKYPDFMNKKGSDPYIVEALDSQGRTVMAHPNRVEAQGLTVVKEYTVDEYKQRVRKEYYESFQMVKEAAIKAADTATPGNYEEVLKEVKKAVGKRIEELRAADNFSSGANGLINFHNNKLAPNKKTGVSGELLTFVRLGKEKGMDHVAMTEPAIKVLEGKSPEKAFGVASGKAKRWTVADAYVKHAERQGPNTGLNSQEAQTNFLMGPAGLRGLQWGNSVTDDERQHHLKYTAEAFKDLTDILGLPEEMGSFNGKLGLAIGARGKGSAMAHYEPDTNVINLTRKNGVGSLAHEWGHFWDKTLADTHDRAGSFLSKDRNGVDSSVGKAMQGLMKSDTWMEFYNQVVDEARNNPLIGTAKIKYWTSTEEMFARSFESYIDHKLEKAGRTNTYLAGSPKGGMWPTREIDEKLAPHFDELFKAFRESEHLKKSILENPNAEIDINTSEQSLDEMASKNNPWMELITQGVKDHDYGQPPCEVALPDQRTLIISKVDEGLYSAYLKNTDPESGEFGQVLSKFTKMTPEAMVQAMKAKEYLPREESKEEPQEPETKPGNMYTDLADALKYYSGGQLHIHIHKD